ncbi:carbohydrate ABC transporter permease [Paenarthrobacter nitroguajacolicus]|uniref:carbohydrate ABC transporter permease n=1 Tax=Paenarthrobacter nitroguajacolicus TaxID=211146 RepID=UPI00248B24BB|nr:carbohydrate ABC transporter permease [Paenarthrobacter nitroguajacolicus]MDI2034370.1 L-arabinose transport system permease protein AraQ [Paenarthrobacter nitroguajacolicus]
MRTKPAQDPPPRVRSLSWRNLGMTIAGGYIPLALATLVVFVPLLWMMMSSLKAPGEIVTTGLALLPKNPGPQNYLDATSTVPFPRFFLNSVIVTAVGSALKCVLAIFTAYALVFVRFPFKRVIFLLILVALMVPPQVSVLPNYVLIASMGGLNTYWGIILPGLGTAFGTFLLRQHFLTLPPAILESAEIDGAGHWRKLWKIVVPVSVPSIATVGLVTIVSEWNEYIWPLIVTDHPDMMTLPVGLTQLVNSDGSTQNWGMLMAGAVIVLLPILVIFAALQRYIVSGLTQGSVTG